MKYGFRAEPALTRSQMRNNARNVRRDHHIVEFVAVDGEGIQGPCKRCDCKHYESPDTDMENDNLPCARCGHEKYHDHPHIYVLLGCGDQRREWPNGLTKATEAFEFLYSCFLEHPTAAFVGFFLGYDFDQILKHLPRDRANMLINGSDKRARTKSGLNHKPFPVRFAGWEFDMLGEKRLQIRPQACDCVEFSMRKCEHAQAEWMYICDTGPFFQKSLLAAIDPDDWDKDTPVVSAEEYAIIEAGKGNRANANLDDDMRRYNALENEVLSRLMTRVNEGFVKVGIRLRKNQWFGPGQSAQNWMSNRDNCPTLPEITEHVRSLPAGMELSFKTFTREKPKSNLSQYVTFFDEYYILAGEYDTWQASVSALPEDRKFWSYVDRKTKLDVPRGILDAYIASYYGGWFELFMHGHIPATVYEYDLNSAYPYVIANLPCWCEKGEYVKGRGTPAPLDHSWLFDRTRFRTDTVIRLCHVKVRGNNPFMGGLPHRLDAGFIQHPTVNFGWFFQHEIDMAIAAGLISDIEYLEWIEHRPCGHVNPMMKTADLYQERLNHGKDSVLGKSAKLTYNSEYGKLAQSQGQPKFANPIYASLITSGCRALILDAIATHPSGKGAALTAMIATDGVYFMEPHTLIDAEIATQPLNKKGKHEDTRLGYWGRAEKTGMTLFKPGVYWDDKTRALIADGRDPRFKARGISAKYFGRVLGEVDDKFSDLDPNGTFSNAVAMETGRTRNEWPEQTFSGGFSQVSVKDALNRTRGNSENVGKYYALAGRVTSGQELKQSADPSTKRQAIGAYFDAEYKVWRTPPITAIGGESVPYSKKFGTVDEEFIESQLEDQEIRSRHHPDFADALGPWRGMVND